MSQAGAERRDEKQIPVLLADDHARTRRDIREAVERDPAFRVVAEAKDAASAVAEAIVTRPALCLLDIRMPGSGIAAAWEITSRLPDTKVVMLTISSDEKDLFAALRAGAAGYLLKDIDPERLPHALRDVLEGEAAIPRPLVARILETFRDRSPRRRELAAVGPGPHLTSREWEVLDLLRQGLTTGQIAGKLYVSQATVRSHVAAILRKLRVPDRKSAVRLFEES